MAGGLEVALSCDLIVAAEGAKLGIPESKRSLVAAGGALLRLPRRMPYHVVMELALTGDTFPAERFHELGLVNRLAAPGTAVDVAIELAEAIGTQRPARAGRRQADPPGAVRLVDRRDVGEAGRDRRPRDDLRGRQGGRVRLQGEARAGLEGPLGLRPALTQPLPSHSDGSKVGGPPKLRTVVPSSAATAWRCDAGSGMKT